MNIIYNLPKLFILSNGKKRFWEIWIEEDKNKNIFIHRKYGIINGKITNQIKEIKHKGTITSFEKAITQSNALWRKKKEAGFQEENSIKHNNNIKTKSQMIKPMGAYKLNDHFLKIKYPACVQKKLDGFRCLTHVENNKIMLYSKNMKKFIFLNHIKKELAKIKELSNSNIYLDGELYEFGLGLHNISSLVMKKYATQKNENEMKKISYYIFDMFNLNNMNTPFSTRYSYLQNIFKKYKFKYIKLVNCNLVNTYEEIKNLDTKYLLEGFEGVIVRNLDGVYKLNSKSYDVLRTKEFKKKEFEIIGAKEGTGTQKGAIIWNLKCLNHKNHSFWAIPIGTIGERIKYYKEYEKNATKFIGKKALVKFLEIDKNVFVYRNPIVLSLL
jgi:DNA ligase-1